jgi:hypothetical protein
MSLGITCRHFVNIAVVVNILRFGLKNQLMQIIIQTVSIVVSSRYPGNCIVMSLNELILLSLPKQTQHFISLPVLVTSDLEL